jgi:uncharacterized protein (TIGR02266 family)
MIDYSNIPRDSRRVPLETRVQFKFDRFSGFISDYSANISPGGMFIRSRAPQPQGTVFDIEFRLGDGFELIKGRAEVVWTRTEDEGPTRPAGMGLRFLELSPGSKELIYRIVDQHILMGGTPFDVTQRPPDPVAVLPPPAEPQPWPRPAPSAPSQDIFDLPPLSAPSAPTAAPAPPAWNPDPLPEPLPDPSSWLTSSEGLGEDPYPPPRSAEPFPDLLTPPEPEPLAQEEPAAAAPAPMFATTFGSASVKPPRRALPWVLLAVGLALVAAIVLFRDQVMGLIGLGEDEEIAQAAPPARPRLPQRPPAAALSEPGPAVTTDTVVAEVAPSEAASAPVLEEAPAPPPAPEPVPAAPAASAATGTPLTGVEKITFEQTGGGTDVILWGNGAVPASVFKQTRIEGDPPRELFRLSGIRKPFRQSRVVVGTPEVLQVRVGAHPGDELHVVLDLTRPNVVVTAVEPGPDRLRIHLQRR